MVEDWRAHESLPGALTLRLGDPARASLSDRRRVRGEVDTPQSLADWPQERRALLIEWLKQTRSEHPKWVALLDQAGSQRHHLAVDALLGLLLRGWIEYEEVTSRALRGSWQPRSLTWLDLNALREHLGLKDPAAERARRENQRWLAVGDERLLALAMALAGSPARSISARRQLCDALVRWLQQGKRGTRRHFAQFARDRTKAIHTAEWQWLAQHVDLPACGISEHAPMMTLGGRCTLIAKGYVLIDLAVMPQHMALTPVSLAHCDQLAGVLQISIVENLTSFTQACEQARAGELVLWQPGYVASWWLQGLQHLVKLAQCPVRIACDCDPWGIDLAMRAGAAVSQAGGHWQPWRMDAATLNACRHRIELTDADRRKLEQILLQDLPPELAALAQEMDRLSQKAEQEQYL
ncbi:DUF2399 domain-containing protein [Silvimonas amylolytica]|uniref:DUF2399 domain-containing protein n=1 Tax=Silvimonas amylolytica TaxID=449663 RepID=A0ABQ2PKA2_9NEIS|nr:DUF2399 domain-containing protein [Silvimonas amylolytica]GGP25409.1 hypothetical protein GCM10010971_12280 [Silvimonas amylolytica]